MFKSTMTLGQAEVMNLEDLAAILAERGDRLLNECQILVLHNGILQRRLEDLKKDLQKPVSSGA